MRWKVSGHRKNTCQLGGQNQSMNCVNIIESGEQDKYLLMIDLVDRHGRLEVFTSQWNILNFVHAQILPEVKQVVFFYCQVFYLHMEKIIDKLTRFFYSFF